MGKALLADGDPTPAMRGRQHAPLSLPISLRAAAMAGPTEGLATSSPDGDYEPADVDKPSPAILQINRS